MAQIKWAKAELETGASRGGTRFNGPARGRTYHLGSPTRTEQLHKHGGQQRGRDVQGLWVPLKEQAPRRWRAGTSSVHLLEAQYPVPQVEVGEVATEGVVGREPATQGVLILTQHKHTVGWHRVTRAESLSPSASPPIAEQRPAPAALLPRDTHVVPAAVGAEDSTEGCMVASHH